MDANNGVSPLQIVHDEKSSREPWYKNGLRFSCTGCGKCCTGFPGAVWVSDEEISAIADKFQISIEEAEAKYTRFVGGDERRSLKEIGASYDCVFLLNKKECQIYDIRPRQCRTYPLWPDVLESQAAWNEAKKVCEGIEHPDAPIISKEEIEKVLQGRKG
ncbi:MAG: YkgJ family cysteine cluster protein [Chlamydia sp.]